MVYMSFCFDIEKVLKMAREQTLILVILTVSGVVIFASPSTPPLKVASTTQRSWPQQYVLPQVTEHVSQNGKSLCKIILVYIYIILLF